MQSFKPSKLLPLILAGLLTACAGASSETNSCRDLPLVAYPKAVQAKVAAEIDAAPQSASWPTFVHDYGTLRAALRACRSTR